MAKKRHDIGRKLDDSINQPGTTLPSTSKITNPTHLRPYSPTPTIITVPASNPAAPDTDPAATNPAAVAGTGGRANARIVLGQIWCIAKSGVPESSLQKVLDYACAKGADCSMIQRGASCYNPNSVQSHASYALNSYFQKNPQPSSCDFGGNAVLVNSNPSTGTCVYPSSAMRSMP